MLYISLLLPEELVTLEVDVFALYETFPLVDPE
jgi:hypothetical protein